MPQYHVGMDCHGSLQRRLRNVAEVRRARELMRLVPVVVTRRLGNSHIRWRNGLHRRRWLLICSQVRGDRRCFLTTLSRAPLVMPLPPF